MIILRFPSVQTPNAIDCFFFFFGAGLCSGIINPTLHWYYTPISPIPSMYFKTWNSANSSNYTNLILPKRCVYFLSWPLFFLEKVWKLPKLPKVSPLCEFSVGSSAWPDRVSGADRGCRELLRSHAGLYRCARLSPNSIGLNGHSWRHSGTTSCERSGGDWFKSAIFRMLKTGGGGKGWFVVWSLLSEMVDVFVSYNWGVLRLSEKWSI